MQRDVVWEWLDRPGLEHLSLTIEPGAVAADGVIVVDLGAGVIGLRYSVRCDGDWRVRAASLSLDHRDTSRAVALVRDDLGHWHVNGTRRDDLAACTDIDIMGTPFTNTLPIRRLPLPSGKASRLWMAYVRIPELSVDAFEQEYTKLDPAAPPGQFRYRSVASGFLADLAVDEDGIVVDYEGVWRRRGGR